MSPETAHARMVLHMLDQLDDLAHLLDAATARLAAVCTLCDGAESEGQRHVSVESVRAAAGLS